MEEEVKKKKRILNHFPQCLTVQGRATTSLQEVEAPECTWHSGAVTCGDMQEQLGPLLCPC